MEPDTWSQQIQKQHSSEAKILEAIVQGTSDAIYAKDLQGRYILFNAAASIVTGKKSDEVIGKDDQFLFPLKEAKVIMAQDRKIMDEGVNKTYEEIATGVDGVERVFLSTKGPLFDEAGKVCGLFGIARDITERKKMEAALREVADQNRALAQTMTQGVVFQDATGKIISLNPAAEKILGRTQENFLGSSSIKEESRTIHEDGSPFPGLDHPAMVSLRTGRTQDGVIMGVFNPKEKAYRWISIGAVPMFYDGAQKPYGVYTVFEDITQRKLAEDRLRESRRFLENLIDSTPSNIYCLDEHQKFTMLNSAAARFYGLSKKEVLGTPLENIFPKEIADRHRQLNNEVLATGRPSCVEENLYSIRNSDSHIMMTSKFPIRDEKGKIIGVAGVSTDVTEIKRAQDSIIETRTALENAKNKSKFLDIAAHELRNPVTAISLLIQLIEKQLEKGLPLNRSMLSRLRDPVDRLTRLVVDLLDVSRIERGLVSLRWTRSDLVEIISRSLEEFLLQNPDREFVFNPPMAKLEVEMDPMRIAQVLSNLLDNAVKYSLSKSAIEVTLELFSDFVRISVIDHGLGISKEQIGKLFDPFSRGTSDATVRTSGLGLGLAVCRGILELHGGKIGCVSEEGKGSTFYFDLLLKRSAN